MRARTLVWIAGAAALLVAVLLAAAALIDEPLRAYVERQANEHLEGYRLRIGELDLHPLTLGLDLKQLELRQVEHPEPPLLIIPRWTAGVSWRQLVRGRIASDHRLEQPVIQWTRPQVKEAKKDLQEQKEASERPWQDVVQSLYPMTISEWAIVDADITYRDHPDAKPIRLKDFDLILTNLRNVTTAAGVYPSTVRLETRVFDEGRLHIDGRADVMAIPYPAIKAIVRLETLPLGKLIGLLGRYHIQLTQGEASAEGAIDHSPEATRVDLHTLSVKNAKVDYVYADTAQQKSGTGAEAAQETLNEPGFVVMIHEANIENSEFGFVNHAEEPGYRVFLSRTDLYLENLSNHVKEGTGVLRLRGMLMGSGATTVKGVFRPESPMPDFDLSVQIMDTRLPAMNDLFRTYANLDLAEGTFSFFSELTIRNGTVEGYVKPHFQSIKIYDRAQDRHKGVMQRAYEGVVGGLSSLLSNRPREEVATKTDVRGPVGGPNVSTWEAVLNLVRNAFVRAILPGLVNPAA